MIELSNTINIQKKMMQWQEGIVSDPLVCQVNDDIACNDALKGRVTLNKDFDPSPNSGVVIVNGQDSLLRIDFLATVLDRQKKLLKKRDKAEVQMLKFLQYFVGIWMVVFNGEFESK